MVKRKFVKVPLKDREDSCESIKAASASIVKEDTPAEEHELLPEINADSVPDHLDENGNEDFEDIPDSSSEWTVPNAKDSEVESERELTLSEKYLAPTDSEDDDFEAPFTTIGNVPLEWYDDYPHLGYDVEGKKVLKPVTKDELDAFLDKMDNPEFLATFRDHSQHKDVTLTSEELDIIKKLQEGHYPDEEIDAYPDLEEVFVNKVMQEPLSGAPEPKRRFIPSKWEHNKVMKLARAIRKGEIVVRNGRIFKSKPQEETKERYYDIWKDEDPSKVSKLHISAPKLKLPEHSESYNPPEEYLPTEEEKKQWEDLDPEDRPLDYLPQKYDNLRSVPGYGRLINERFSRCLDLYLCPRAVRKRYDDVDALLPELPDTKDLEPFPKHLAITFKGHTGRVRQFSVDNSGQWMVSVSEDKTCKLWEVSTGMCIKTWVLEKAPTSVYWNPSKSLSFFAICCGKDLIMINPKVDNSETVAATNEMLKLKEVNKKNIIEWVTTSKEQEKEGICLILRHKEEISGFNWHKKGDYFVSYHSTGKANAVLVHQLTKATSQSPFSKSKGRVQKVMFHPNEPFLFVATQRYVRIYNLIRQQLHKVLQPSMKWISSMDIHPGGKNVLVGSYDKKLCWFDTDLSTQPYQNMRMHEYAVRNVVYHKRYPLFASCSDDGKLHLFHGMVYNDFLKNPTIVPLKIITAHTKDKEGLGALHCEFHPTQPWIITSGSDGTIKLFS